MSRKANPTAIGIFVTGAIVITAMALIAVGSGLLLRKERLFITYFRGDANGLDVGSTVRMGGVPLGEVKEITIQIDPETNEKLVPVIIGIDSKKAANIVPFRVDGVELDYATRRGQEELIGRGLRARLSQESFVTGKLFVDLDFLPKEKGFVYDNSIRPDLIQIPSVPGAAEMLLKSIQMSLDKIASINFNSLINKVDNLVETTGRKVDEFDVASLNKGVARMSDDFHSLVDNPDLRAAITDIRQTMANLKSVSGSLEGTLGPAADDLRKTLAKAIASMESFDKVAGNLEKITSSNGMSVTRVNDVLQELRRTADAWKALAEFLQRNPNAIISGRR